MGRVLRAQLSLSFTDEQLYDDLVIPLKQSRELNLTVERLLEAYYYDSNVRDRVDNFGIEGYEPEEQDNSCDEAFRAARETLAVMSILSDSAMNTFEDGIENIMSTLNGGGTSQESKDNVRSQCIAALPEIIQKTVKKNAEISEASNPSKAPTVAVEDNELSKKVQEHDTVLKTLTESVSSLTANVSALLDKLNSGSSVPISEVVSKEINNSAVSPVSRGDVAVVKEIPAPVRGTQSQSIVENLVENVENSSNSSDATDLFDIPVTSNQEEPEEEIDGEEVLKSFLSNGFGFAE